MHVVNTGGTTEYRLEFGTALNSTGQTWTEFQITGGLGLGEYFVRIADLPPGTLPTGLDWDTPDKDTVGSFDKFLFPEFGQATPNSFSADFCA